MRILQIPHKVCVVNCMWNPVEDVYTMHTGFSVPNHLFFSISGIGNFIYLKNKKMRLKRTVYWGNALTKKMYEFMTEIAGFEFSVKENMKFGNMFKSVKELIDRGMPVVLGALDMFHLEYFEKFYHRFHIPIHYVLAVGYDEYYAYVLDCDRQEVQRISIEDLEKALDVNMPGYCRKNTFFTIDFKEKIGIEEITVRGFRKKALFNVNPPVNIMGIPGMRKLACEIGNWHEEMSGEEYEKCLMNMAEFSGFPPILPSKISGYDTDGDISHRGGTDVLAGILYEAANMPGLSNWREAADRISESGELIEEITNEISDAILNRTAVSNAVPEKISCVADLQEKAYSLIIG